MRLHVVQRFSHHIIRSVIGMAKKPKRNRNGSFTIEENQTIHIVLHAFCIYLFFLNFVILKAGAKWKFRFRLRYYLLLGPFPPLPMIYNRTSIEYVRDQSLCVIFTHNLPERHAHLKWVCWTFMWNQMHETKPRVIYIHVFFSTFFFLLNAQRHPTPDENNILIFHMVFFLAIAGSLFFCFLFSYVFLNLFGLNPWLVRQISIEMVQSLRFTNSNFAFLYAWICCARDLWVPSILLSLNKLMYWVFEKFLWLPSN